MLKYSNATFVSYNRRFSESNRLISKRIIESDNFNGQKVIIEWAPFDWIDFPLPLDKCTITTKQKIKTKLKNYDPEEKTSFYYNKEVFDNHYDWWEENMWIYKSPIREHLAVSYNPFYYIDNSLLDIFNATLFLSCNKCDVMNLIPDIILQRKETPRKDELHNYVENHILFEKISKHSTIYVNKQPEIYW